MEMRKWRVCIHGGYGIVCFLVIICCGYYLMMSYPLVECLADDGG